MPPPKLTTLSSSTSSRSSSSVSSRRWRRSAICSRSPFFAASISIPARVTRRAKRSGRIAASPRPLERARRGASRSGRSTTSAGSKPFSWRSRSSATRLSASSRRSSGASTWAFCAPAQDPGDQLAVRGVVGFEDAALAGGAVGLLGVAQLAVGAEVALDQPGDPLADQDLRRALGLAQLPVGAAAVVAAVEVLRRREVVLGLGGVADLALDPREAEDAHRLALVRVADQVELAAAEDQVEGVDLALLGLAPLHRVVGELDRLAARDRGLDLGEPLGEVAAAGGGGHRHLDRRALALVERVRVAPGDLLQGQAQRLGVGEAAVGQQQQRGAQRRQLVVGEFDRVEVEVLRRQRVELGLEEPLARLLDPELDAEALELGAVRVEAPREGVVVHIAVALDLALDLQGGNRPALGHQERDQRELANQLLGVLRH